MKGKKRILVIDDDLRVQRVFTIQFERHLCDDFEIFFAENGKVGIERALELHPDLIILDGHMPVMDGLETIRRLKADPKTQGIPIFFVSSDIIIGQEAIKLDAERFFDKCDLQGLITAIKQRLFV